VDPTLIAILRLIHIVLGAIWVGGAVVTAFYILPTARALGPAGAQFTGALVQRARLPLALVIMGSIAILAGIALYAILYAGGPMSSTSVVLGIGGAIAIVVLVIGIVVTKPAADKLVALGQAIAGQGSPPTPAQTEERNRLASRLRTAAIVNAVLLLVAIACMAVARYV